MENIFRYVLSLPNYLTATQSRKIFAGGYERLTYLILRLFDARRSTIFLFLVCNLFKA
jgi:hypothetical protein